MQKTLVNTLCFSVLAISSAACANDTYYKSGQWVPLVEPGSDNVLDMDALPPDIAKAIMMVDTGVQKTKRQGLGIVIQLAVLKINPTTTVIPYMDYEMDADKGYACDQGTIGDPMYSCPFHAITIIQTGGEMKVSGKAPVLACWVDYKTFKNQRNYISYDENTHTVHIKTMFHGKEYHNPGGDGDCSTSIRTTY